MIEKVMAFLDNLNSEELDRLPPARRRKFAALCHHWWQLAERRQEPQQQQQSGILLDLSRGQRQE
jgi:hypothetical protein